jgi:hypothetical protein
MAARWSDGCHRLAGHDGDAVGCAACVLLRMDCEGRIRYETFDEADDWIIELHTRRQLAPMLKVVDCGWCGFWHVIPNRRPIVQRAAPPDPPPGPVVDVRHRGGRRWIRRLFHRDPR